MKENERRITNSFWLLPDSHFILSMKCLEVASYCVVENENAQRNYVVVFNFTLY